MSTTNEEIIAALNAFAARGMAAEGDARSYCIQQKIALGRDFSMQKFMDNFHIAARANDAKAQS